MEKEKLIDVSNYLIQVIRNVLNKHEVLPIVGNKFSYRDVFKLANFHQVENIVYEGINKFIDDDKLKQFWYKKCLMNISMCVAQEEEQKKIEETFKNRHIKFLPVKGYFLRKYYPRSDFRFMSDMDILVEKGKHKEAKKMMVDIGYQVEQYNYYHHDEYVKKPYLMIEIHRSLLPKDHQNHNYYENVFSKAKVSEDNKYFYRLSNEDLYIFNLVHFYKHYSTGGAGIRSLLDIYISLINQDLDLKYISQECEKLGLSEFKEKMEKISLEWFKSGIESEELKKEKEFILESGVYGTSDHFVHNNLEENKGSKIKLIFKRLFPGVKKMKSLYPILDKVVILLPFCYIHRFFRAIFSSRARNELKQIKNK